MADLVRINGNQHSWSSTILKIQGERFTGVKSIAYGDKRERVKAYGMGRHYAPRGRTSGKYTIDPLKLSVFTGSAQLLRDLFASGATDGVSIGNVEASIVLQMIELNDTPVTVEFVSCVIIGIGNTHEENPDPTVEEWELDVMQILRNGESLFNQVEGSP